MPNALVADNPVNVKLASQSKVSVPTAVVPTCEEGVTSALATTVIVPSALVDDRPVTSTDTPAG